MKIQDIVEAKLFNPREEVLKHAMQMLDASIEADKNQKQSDGSHAFDVARRFNIGMSARQLLRLYRAWKNTGNVLETWILENAKEILEARRYAN